MNGVAIFWPLLAQVALTLAVAVRMFIVRVGEMRERRIDPQAIATTRSATLLQNVAAADNFRNLFEVPVLFFTVCPVLYVTGTVTPLQIFLAWAFVALRCLHSLIQVTTNRVLHRFAAFVLGFACVVAMWTGFALRLLHATF